MFKNLQICALVLPMLEKEDRLNIKLVCKRWNKSLCLLVRQCPLKSPLSTTLELYGSTLTYGYAHANTQRRFEMQTPKCFQLAQIELKNHFTFNALQGIKFLPLVDLNDNALETYWIEAKQFLREYGKHISVAVIGLVYSNDSFKSVHNLASVLELLPNLVRVVFVSIRYENGVTSYFPISNVEAGQIKENVKLPRLRYLQCVTFESDSQLNDIVKTLLLQTQISIKKVEMGMWVFSRAPQMISMFNNITDLFLFDVYSLVYLGKILTKLSQSGQSLRNLHISFSYKIITSDLFALLEDTKIEKLNAEFESIEDGEMYEPLSAPPMVVPSLISLSIDDNNDLTRYEFLYWLPNLRYLTLRGKGTWTEDDHNDEHSRLSYSLKQCLYTSKAPDSWFWRKMPKLLILVANNDMENFFENGVHFIRPIELSF